MKPLRGEIVARRILFDEAAPKHSDRQRPRTAATWARSPRAFVPKAFDEPAYRLQRKLLFERENQVKNRATH